MVVYIVIFAYDELCLKSYSWESRISLYFNTKKVSLVSKNL